VAKKIIRAKEELEEEMEWNRGQLQEEEEEEEEAMAA
jgi:hypothetical protein